MNNPVHLRAFDIVRMLDITKLIHKLVRENCEDSLEAYYALKASVYLCGHSIRAGGVYLDNDAEIEADIKRILDKYVLSELPGHDNN